MVKGKYLCLSMVGGHISKMVILFAIGNVKSKFIFVQPSCGINKVVINYPDKLVDMLLFYLAFVNLSSVLVISLPFTLVL